METSEENISAPADESTLAAAEVGPVSTPVGEGEFVEIPDDVIVQSDSEVEPVRERFAFPKDAAWSERAERDAKRQAERS